MATVADILAFMETVAPKYMKMDWDNVGLLCGSKALKFGGDFFLVHKPERLAELISIAAGYNLEAKRLGLVRHKEGGPVNLILLQFRKGGKPGLVIEEAYLHHSDGTPSDYYKEIYHIP